MECKDCEYAVYDDFNASYTCHKDSDNKELKFYPKRNAPKCDRKIDKLGFSKGE